MVLELCDGLFHEGRTLYTDNFYTGIGLARKLLEKGIHLVGTLRKTRKELTKSVINYKLQLNEVYGEENNEGIVVMKWKPKKNKDVLMLSTKHSFEMKTIPRRINRRDTNENNVKQMPIAIIDYNNGKCGIDKSDQMSSYATSIRKGIKWCRKVALEMLTGTAIVNAHIIYKQVTSKNITISKFREEVCISLLGFQKEKIKKVKIEHLLMKCTEQGTKDRKNCIPCYANLLKTMPRNDARKKVKRVKTYCSGCPGKPTMCFDCHISLHRKD